MFKNYLIVAFRNFRRNKVFSFINVLSLAIGISASLVIFLIVHFSFGFDKFEPGRTRIFRVVSDYSEQSNPGYTRGVQGPLAETIKKEIPGAGLVTTFRYFSPASEDLLKPGMPKPTKLPRQQRHTIFADTAYFSLLPYHWLAGSRQSALSRPGQVVLTKSRAKVCFGDIPYDQMIGSQIIYSDTVAATVTGIVEDLDKQGNTDYVFNEFISLSTLLDNHGLRKNFYWDDWGGCTSDQQLYLKLPEATSPSAIEAKIRLLGEKYLGEDEKKSHYTWTYALQPFGDIHFNDHYGLLDKPVANENTLNGLMLIALFLLLLGSINFVNLTTAESVSRSGEIGIRKTLGASKMQLVFQFMSETFLTTVCAGIISLALVPLLLQAFASFIPEGVHFSYKSPTILSFLALLVLAVSFCAGIYPSLVLSSWNAIVVLKNQAFGNAGKTGKARTRQALTISQFVIAQFFIISSILVSRQIRFMLDSDLGFKKEAILSFHLPGRDTSVSHRLTLLNEIRNIPGVSLTSLASDVTNSGSTWSSDMEFKDGKKDMHIAAQLKAGDDNYLKLFDIPIIAGRNLLPADTVREVVINQTYQQLLGFKRPEDALGKIFFWQGKNVPIVGVMKDFHAHSLSREIRPLAFVHLTAEGHVIVAAMRPDTKSGWKRSTAQMEKAFKSIYPDDEFEYGFLDESIAKSYEMEEKIAKLLEWATGLTLLISCLGLLGLVIYTTNHRTKEIGVRKVLGASAAQIVSILSKDFLSLVAVAFLIAIPLGWWAIHYWLTDYAYRAPISWWVFPLGGIGMLLVSFITLSFRTIQAARANPAKSLRTQ